MHKLFALLIIATCFSCKSNTETKSAHIVNTPDTVRVIETVVDTVFLPETEEVKAINDQYYIVERLPDWFDYANVFDGLKVKKEYAFDNRLNPLYHEADFNGDGQMDLAIPIIQLKTKKVGFAIIHGKTNKIFIIGAGTVVKNAFSDNLDYMDIWKVSRSEINPPGVDEVTGTGKGGELILKNPSLDIQKSELGGGLFYWNGTEYAYFHQTC